MFYVIENKYTGPNQDQDQYADVDTIVISTTPAVTNSSNEERTDGWCGTTNDWAVYAHGEYETIEAARAAIAEQFGDVRDRDANWDEFESMDDDVVEVFKPGKYEPMCKEAVADWSYETAKEEITAETTDEEIAGMVDEYESEANSNGSSCAEHIEDVLIEFRDNLREEMDE
jgi:hypothetical protein